ncbi:MAG TPA: FAD-binding oxidoreductase, partial [Phnomibacter sp.]|nr:FAD-binding oxidoreductase [Phnomibacter sp.]
DEPPQMNRVTGILKAAQQYYPQAQIPQPTLQEVWYGYRPCSADGLPYIGRINHLPNVIIATGHAMVGMSLGAATGKLVAELAAEQSTSMNMAPFSPHRFE